MDREHHLLFLHFPADFKSANTKLSSVFHGNKARIKNRPAGAIYESTRSALPLQLPKESIAETRFGKIVINALLEEHDIMTTILQSTEGLCYDGFRQHYQITTPTNYSPSPESKDTVFTPRHKWGHAEPKKLKQRECYYTGSGSASGEETTRKRRSRLLPDATRHGIIGGFTTDRERTLIKFVKGNSTRSSALVMAVRRKPRRTRTS